MRCLLPLVLLAASASVLADDAKPNRIERGVHKVEKGVEHVVNKTEKGVKRTAERTGNWADRTAKKTEKKVKKILE